MLNVTACDSTQPKSNDLEKPPFAQKDITIEKARELAKAADTSEGVTVNPIQTIGSNNLAGPIGLKTDQLFSTPVADDTARFARLENTVQKIADRLKELGPSVSKLIGIERDFDNLTFQLETLIDQGSFENVGNTNSNNSQEITPATQQITTKTSNSTKSKRYKKPKIQAGNLIKTMRIADHPGKTRIVFEMTQKLALDPYLDNAEGLITIDLGAANLGSNPNSLAQSTKLFTAISQNQNGDNTTLVFETTTQTQKIEQGYIAPNKDNSAHRVFIDFKR